MTWDRDNLNAPHTEREIAMIEDIGADIQPVDRPYWSYEEFLAWKAEIQGWKNDQQG